LTISITSLANRALDLVGKDTFLDIETSTDSTARLVKRNFEPVLLRCLRKSDWPFALSRKSLNPDTVGPINEFQYTYNLPSDFVKMTKTFDSWIRYKMEGPKRLVCDEQTLTVLYVNNKCLTDPSLMDPSFEEYFAHELAVSLTYKLSDSVNLRKELEQKAQLLFEEAAAMHSQEGTDDPLPASPWISTRYYDSPYIGPAGCTRLDWNLYE